MQSQSLPVIRRLCFYTKQVSTLIQSTMKYVPLAGRILYSFMFLMTIVTHFSHNMVGYAETKGVPMAAFLVPFSGIIAFAGGVSVILGFKAKIGAWLIVIFLVPVTFVMHDFWNILNVPEAQMQMGMFMKNISMLGAALMITYFGAGPVSIDSMRPTKI